MTAAIQTQALTKYYGKSRGVIDLNFSVEEGETYGFIGPNGAGKSTTIRLFLSLLFPTSGKAEIFGHDIIREDKKIKQMVGFVPSEVHFYDHMKVKDLLEYSARFYKVSLNGHYKNLLEIFEIDLDKKFEELSMGNKKKVAVVQALLHQPRLLILDEPTSGLDPLMQNRFFKLISEENNKGTTVFFSSHILSEVEKLCHRVAIIKEGKIVREDDIAHIKSTQLSRVTIHLTSPGESISIKTAGVIEKREMLDGITFLFKGDTRQLLRDLSELPIGRIKIEEPDLEEVFMHYYEDKNGEDQS
ncbi:MAG: ABC transporter ATP-binding protein [Bacteroidota bacterium]|nr:ABC transporter ATP-binding protein [Bacteroidota bacterium]